VKLVSALLEKKARIFQILPTWLVSIYPNECTKFYEKWAHWLDRTYQEGQLDDDEISEYISDFVDCFVGGFILGRESQSVLSIMTSMLNVSGENLFLPLAIYFFLRSDDALREKFLRVLLPMKCGERYEKTLELLGSWFHYFLSTKKMHVSAAVRRLINICRLSLEFDKPESIEMVQKHARKAELDIDLSDLIYHIANCIVENTLSEEASLYKEGVLLSFIKDHANLTFKIEPIGEVPRYIKVGISERVRKEEIGNQILTMEIARLEKKGQKVSLKVPRQWPDFQSMKERNMGIIAILGLSGSSFSEIYKNGENRIIKALIKGVFGDMRKLYNDTEKDTTAPLEFFYKLEKTPKMSKEIKTQFKRQMRTKKCLVHGDFHAGNIFIEENMTRSARENPGFYLLDLEDVGESHYLKDFVALETSIRINLMDWKKAEEAEGAIKAVEQTWFRDGDKRIEGSTKIIEPLVAKWLSIDDHKPSATDSELFKAYSAINTIRTAAKDLAIELGISTAQFNLEYYLCLIWYLYKYLQFEEDVTAIKKHYASQLIKKLPKYTK
jgi:hypothetical protein